MKKSVTEMYDELKVNLLEMISEAAEDLDEVCEEVANIISEEGVEAIGQADLLLYCADADYAMQIARAVTFEAVHSDMPADMAKDIINAAAELGLTAEALTEAFSEALDEALDEADQVLEVAMDMLAGDGDKNCEGCPGCCECDGCEDRVLDLEYIAQVLIDAGLCEGGEKITLEIGPSEDGDDDDEDSEEWNEPDEDDPEEAASAEAFNEIGAYLASVGLLKEGQTLTISIDYGDDN